MEDFKLELAALLRKHKVAIVCHSNKNNNDFSVEIGFQNMNMKYDFKTEWVGRHHVTSYDLDSKQ